MGGCPEFRDTTVTAFDTAARNVLLNNVSRQEAGDAASYSIFNAAFELFFDQFRADEFK